MVKSISVYQDYYSDTEGLKSYDREGSFIINFNVYPCLVGVRV